MPSEGAHRAITGVGGQANPKHGGRTEHKGARLASSRGLGLLG